MVQVEEQYQREMGIAAQQRRIDAYMRSHTLTGEALLDPTSHVHPYPSENVSVKPAGFGLGHSGPEAIQKVGRKHVSVQGELGDSLLLPSKFRCGLATFFCAAAIFGLEHVTVHTQPVLLFAKQQLVELCMGFVSAVAWLLCREELRGGKESKEPSATPPTGRPLTSNSNAMAAGRTAELGGTANNVQPGDVGRTSEEDQMEGSDGDSGGDDDELLLSSHSRSGRGLQGSKARMAQLPIMKLSKLEADMLQQRREHHKATVVQPKVGMHKQPCQPPKVSQHLGVRQQPSLAHCGCQHEHIIATWDRAAARQTPYCSNVSPGIPCTVLSFTLA